MNEYQKKNIFLIVIAAIIIAVSASFSNNYFAYYFLSKSIELTPKTSRKASSPINKLKGEEIDIDTSWVWNYSDIAAKENNYPIVVLRDGYKAIKLFEDKVLMGWNYVLLNTSFTTNYTVTINYRLEDEDGFIVNESSSTENIPPKEIRTIKQTTLVSYGDYKRIEGRSWHVRVTPAWINEKLSGTPFERAGAILKEEAPYWLRTYLTHLFIRDFPREGDKKGFSQIFFPNKWVIAQGLGIKIETKLIEIGKKLNIDFNKYNLPPWKEIAANPNYASLGKDEKDILKKFLRVEKEYGEYSPENGRKSNFTYYKEDLPEPSELK